MAITLDPQTIGVIIGSGIACFAGGAKAMKVYFGRKNGSGGSTCKDHGKVCQALETGEEKFRVIEQKLDDMPLKIITLLKDTKGLL